MLIIKGLYKTFFPDTPTAVVALRDIHLSLEPGSFTAIIGTNGSGKTSLLNAVAGTFRPDSGQIFLGDKHITGWPEHHRARYVGRVFQIPYDAFGSDHPGFSGTCQIPDPDFGSAEHF